MFSQDQLTPVLQRLDQELYALAAELMSSGPYRFTTFVPSEEALSSLRCRTQALLPQLRAARESGHDALFCQHLEEFAQSLLLAIQSDIEYPSYNYVNPFIGLLQSRTMLFADMLCEQESTELLLSRYARARDFYAGLSAACSQLPAQRIQHCRDRASSFLSDMARAAGAVKDWKQSRALRSMLSKLERDTGEFIHQLDALLASPRQELPGTPYESIAQGKFGFDLSWIYSWYEKDLEEMLLGLKEAAAAIDPHRTVFEVYQQAPQYFTSAEAMFQAAADAAELARTLAHRYVQLPAGESLVLRPVPEAEKDRLPWGQYGSPDPGRLRGCWFLNDDNYAQVNEAWIWIMAVHECYPGHHTQFVKTAANANLPLTCTISRPGHSQPLVEGLAHRSEKYMMEISDSKVMPLAFYYRRVHTTLRIKTQLLLSIFQEDPGEVYRYYVDQLGMPEKAARAHIRSQTMNPGRTYSYYYGARYLQALEEELGVSEPDFVDAAFSAGFVSLPVLGGLLRRHFAASGR